MMDDTMKATTRTCSKCDQLIYAWQKKAIIYSPDSTRYEHLDCLAAALIRAKTAERELAELKASLGMTSE